jgi:hypothetical protein
MPGSARSPSSVSGKVAVLLEGHDAGAFQQVPRPRVVAEPRPFAHHLGILGVGEPVTSGQRVVKRLK